jgi:hypothetical protein
MHQHFGLSSIGLLGPELGELRPQAGMLRNVHVRRQRLRHLAIFGSCGLEALPARKLNKQQYFKYSGAVNLPTSKTALVYSSHLNQLEGMLYT